MDEYMKNLKPQTYTNANIKWIGIERREKQPEYTRLECGKCMTLRCVLCTPFGGNTGSFHASNTKKTHTEKHFGKFRKRHGKQLLVRF